MSESIYETALFIIQSTNDGEDLAPHHLKLVEMAANGHLNEEGEVAFYELAANVQNGYQQPWFHNQEHLTISHEGWVYWRGKQVEHYTPSWAYSEKAKESAQELAHRCAHLESLGEEVTIEKVIRTWEEYASRSGPGNIPAR